MIQSLQTAPDEKPVARTKAVWTRPKLTLHGAVETITAYPRCPDGRPDPSGIGLPEYCDPS